MAKKQLPVKGRSRGKGSRFDRLVGIGIIVAVVVIALILWGPLRTMRRVSGEKPVAQQAKKPFAQKPDEKAEAPEKTGKPTKKPAKDRSAAQTLKPSARTILVAIVIDDLGQDLKPAQELLALPARITYAVLPGLAQSKKVAELARQNKRELLLHLPMEPKNRSMKASPGTLRSDMTPMDFLTTLSDDVASVPGAVGVNNHEGSALTENREAMKFLMAELKARELLFLDSLTSPRSIAFATAKEFGLKAAKRDVFLDNEGDNADYIAKQLEELARVAKERGRAIGIGHPHPATIAALRKWLPMASQQGIEIVSVSRLMQ
jgi:polysaccharide deacetylase 2 family uncharacterized protein YibQ